MEHRVRELAHTADVGFEVRAPSLEGLFEGAARGLVEALGLEADGGSDDASAPADAADRTGAGADREALRLSRPDLERLFVHWLRELLARAMAGGEVPDAAVREVRPGDGGEASLRASVRWRPAAAPGPKREIKGVTYHGLRVARGDDGWHARVVLDV